LKNSSGIIIVSLGLSLCSFIKENNDCHPKAKNKLLELEKHLLELYDGEEVTLYKFGMFSIKEEKSTYI
jgi:nucleoid DNA-binding protein